ncbi:MAG: DUF4384 domain-containing protein [Spirochaetes bacterium]|nr:MAG: DUF4384 domain-containing protein [Spirochaetota bacterium]
MKKLLIIACLTIILSAPAAIAQQQTVTAGILPFAAQGQGDGEAVIGGLTSSLSGYRFIRLVERAKMKEYEQELALGMGGFVDEASAVKVGKMHGIEIMIHGSVMNGSISARAVHAETQRLIAAATVDGMGQIDVLAKKLAAGIEVFLARDNLKKMRNDSPDITLDIWIERKGAAGKITPGAAGAGRVGEGIVFHFKANRDGYVTIVDIQPGGDVVVLFPNDYAKSNAVKAGREYTIPGEDDAFEFQFEKPAGRDTVAAFFTEKKVDWLDPAKLAGEGFKTVKENEKLEMTRGISLKATGLKKNQWESTVLEVEVSE